MALQHLDPEGVSKPAQAAYSQVVTVDNGRLAFISGQTAVDAAGEVVGAGDFEAQTRQVFVNLQACLSALGVSFSEVIKLNTYIVNFSQELRTVYGNVRNQFLPSGDRPASTLIGVQALARPELLIEIKAIVALP